MNFRNIFAFGRRHASIPEAGIRRGFLTISGLRNLPEKLIRRLHAVAALFNLKIGDYAQRLLERGLDEDFERLNNQHRAEIEAAKDKKGPQR